MEVTALKKDLAIKRWILFIAIFATASGVIFGVVWGSSLKNQEYSTLKAKIEVYKPEIYEDSAIVNFKIEAFNAAIFKYGKYAAFIWFFGFISVGFAGSLCILFSKGLGLGFTTSILLKMFGAGQAAELILSYTLQSLVVFPVYILLSYKSIEFILKYIKQDKGKHSSIIQSNITSYTASYIACCLPLVLVCVAEASF